MAATDTQKPARSLARSPAARLILAIVVYSFATWLSIYKNVTWPQTVLGVFMLMFVPIAMVFLFFKAISHGSKTESAFSAMKTHPFESATGAVVTLSHLATSAVLFSRKQILLALSFALYALAGLPVWGLMTNTM